MRRIFLILVILLVVLISFALAVGVSVGAGWLLAQVLPFSLFEGTVVAMIGAVVAWAIWRAFLEVLPLPGSSPEWVEEDMDLLPTSLFWSSRKDRTWRLWLHYALANAVYDEILDSAEFSDDTEDEALQALAIVLSGAAVKGLEKKPVHTRQVRISPGLLKHELREVKEISVPDEVLEWATKAMNQELRDWQDEVRRVIQEKLWDRPAEV